jgi:hypothetical protein
LSCPWGLLRMSASPGCGRASFLTGCVLAGRPVSLVENGCGAFRTGGSRPPARPRRDACSLHYSKFIRARYVLLSRTCTGRRATLERAGSSAGAAPACVYVFHSATPGKAPVHDHQHPGRAVGHCDRQVRLLVRNPPTRASIEECVPVSVGVVSARPGGTPPRAPLRPAAAGEHSQPHVIRQPGPRMHVQHHAHGHCSRNDGSQPQASALAARPGADLPPGRATAGQIICLRSQFVISSITSTTANVEMITAPVVR